MKIEKLSETQLRCTLNQYDLNSRELKISELAYGKEKAKEFFKELMQQASIEYGFDAENIPLMIEAIPISKDCIVLLVTKIEEPSELDDELSLLDDSTPNNLPDDDIFDDSSTPEGMFDMLKNANGNNVFDDDLNEPIQPNMPKDYSLNNPCIKQFNDMFKNGFFNQSPDYKVFSFADFDDISHASRIISNHYKGRNSAYKNNANGRYYLILVDRNDSKLYDLSIVNSTLLDYGRKENCNETNIAYIDEHYTLLIKDNAINILSQFA